MEMIREDGQKGYDRTIEFIGYDSFGEGRYLLHRKYESKVTNPQRPKMIVDEEEGYVMIWEGEEDQHGRPVYRKVGLDDPRIKKARTSLW